MELIIVTGISGAGKSKTLDLLEDIGYYCVDNIPPDLIPKFAGVIVNIWLKLGVWDYSGLPLNILGQVCLPFYFAWVGLSVVAIVFDDYLRYWFFGEEKPHYKIV